MCNISMTPKFICASFASKLLSGLWLSRLSQHPMIRDESGSLCMKKKSADQKIHLYMKAICMLLSIFCRKGHFDESMHEAAPIWQI